jgi:hypothetical protein
MRVTAGELSVTLSDVADPNTLTDPGSPEPDGTPPASPPQRRRRWWPYAAAALVVLVLVGGGFTAYLLLRSDKAPASPAGDSKSSDAALTTACHDAIKERLKAPGTAQFGGEYIRRTSTGGGEITGWVDAQNGFGALVRNRTVCSANVTSVGWSIADVTLSPW